MGGDEVREILAYRYHPDGDDFRASPRRSDQTSTNRTSARTGSLGPGRHSRWFRCRATRRAVGTSVEGEPEGEKEHGLESTDGMRRGQQVVANLCVGNCHASSVRQHGSLFVRSDDAAKSVNVPALTCGHNGNGGDDAAGTPTLAAGAKRTRREGLWTPLRPSG